MRRPQRSHSGCPMNNLLIIVVLLATLPALANSALLTTIQTMQQIPRSGAYQDEADRQRRARQEEYNAQMRQNPSAPEAPRPCRDLLPSGITPAPGLDRCGWRR